MSYYKIPTNLLHSIYKLKATYMPSQTLQKPCFAESQIVFQYFNAKNN